MIKHVLTGVAVCAGAVALAAGGEVAVKVAKPDQVTESDAYQLVGRVDGTQTVRLSARVVGNLWVSNGDEGDFVKKGDVLYKIEDTVYKANLQSAKAKEAELAAKLALAEIEARRYTDSASKGGVSQSERDRIVLSRDVAKAQLDAARAEVILCQNDLDYCTIASPIDGVIGRGAFDVGNNVGPSSGTLRDVIAVDPIDIVVSIPEPRLIWAFENEQVKKNIRIRLVRADGREFPIDLKVEALDNKVDAATGTVLARFRGANPKRQLMPGGYVKILLSEIFPAPKLAVPTASVVFDGAKRYVYVTKDGVATKREVKLGCSVGDRFFIEEGLSADETLVTAGVHKLFDGAKVKEI